MSIESKHHYRFVFLRVWARAEKTCCNQIITMVMSIPLSVKPKTDFSIRLKQWQGEKPDKIAADILGVNLPTFRHWKYSNIILINPNA